MFDGLLCSTSRMEWTATGAEMHQGAVINGSSLLTVCDDVAMMKRLLVQLLAI